MRIRSILAAFCLLTVSAVASGQDYRYYAYVDADANPGTGCSVVYAGGTVVGAERRLTAEVTGTNVSAVTVASCAGATFGASSSVGGGYPVGLNLGVSGSDVIEFSGTRGQLGADRTASVRLALVGESVGGANDVLLTTTGTVGGGPIVLGLPLSIPLLGGLGLGLLVLALLWVGAARAKRLRMAGLGALLLAGSAWAANFVMDGAIGDWAGESPRAVDATGDASLPDDGADVLQFFAEEENGVIFFRADAVDIENQRPVAASQSQTYLEDAPAQTITLTATDGDGDPLTFAIVTPPTRGVLGAITPINATSASVTYTPNLNANGTDSFTFSANDGQSTSLPATVSITITPVNDAPSFTAGANVTVIKDTGPQTINPWATAVNAGPADESTQTLSFNITNNSNPALFATAPAVSPTGVLTFTGAANANGTATITLNVMDNGGTANGGIDTSAPQTFTITLTAVNDAPSFTAGPNQTVNEDAGPQTVNPWATALSAGPPDEAGQTLSFNITNNTNAALFSAGPAVSATGALTYTPAANANGTATITLNVMDNGGTANGGVDTSAPQTFTITVTPVNDAPSFTAGANVTVLKDTGPQTINPWATALSAGPADESAQTLSFNITGNTNAALFATAPAVSPTGVLTFTGAANANGTATITLNVMDNGGTANGGIDTSAPQTFTITLTAVNDAPSFTAGPNQTVLEDAGAQTVNPWATALSAGPPDEAGQTLTFNITNNTNAALFSAGPAVSATGALTYTPAANANGTATITLNVQDNGGTANGGVDTSPPQTFTITVTAVNDVPSFTVGPNQTVNEDAGAQTVNPWATAISAGPANESGQTVSFNLTGNTNPGLFSAGPAVSPTGVLTYTPAANISGTATITLNVMDNGGTANGGIDTSAPQSFTITVNDVNDAPSFTIGPNQTVNEDSGAQTVNPWATAISPGPANEAGQTVTFNITNNTNPALFSAGPAVSASGVLTYTPAANANGTATITLSLTDNGGTANGGIDTSATQSFTITITGVNDAPVNTVPVGPFSVAINAALPLPGFSVADVDAAAGAVQSVLTVPANSALSATASGAATVGGNGTTTLTVTGNLTDLNATLATLSFVSTTNGIKTLSMTTSDQGNTGTGGALSDGPDTVNITVDKAPEVSATVPSNGATGVLVGSDLQVTFDEAVTLGPTWIQLVCTLSGTRNVTDFVITDADPVFTLNPNTDFAAGENCTATITAAQVTDDDLIDGPNAMLANFVFSFATQDVAPRILSTTPLAAAVVNQNQTLTLNFSESVNVAAGAITWTCPGAVSFTPALPQNGVTTLTLTPTVPLTAGGSCAVAVESTLITDVDAVDPPNELDGDNSGDLVDGDADDFALAFTVDAQPTVTAVSPLNNATGVVVTSNVDITFSEAVTPVGSWFQIVCPISGTRNTGNVAVTGGPTTYTINPNVDFSSGENCVLTVTAAQINDNDLIDPPQGLAADFTSNFTTADVAPTRTTGTAPGLIANNATITLNFSESVNIAAGGISWACAAGFTPALPQNGITTITLTPTGALPDGAACNVTLESTLITDADAVDPPNELDGDNSGDLIDGDADDQVIVYTVDAAPAFTTSTPANGAINVLPSANILVNFSEAVDVTTASFTLNCGAGNLGYAVTGTGTSAITLNPTADLLGGTTCTVTGVPAQINDSDLIDPPANPAAFNFSFTVASVAVDDTYNVNRHLTLAAPAAAELDANDQIGSGTITGFGATLGTANGTTPGTQLDDGANGTLTLNANGTFTFFPPVNPGAGTTDFFYTVTGGDTASITFTYQDELVWFVDDNATGTTCTGDNTGAQACPATTLTTVAGIDTTNDHIFLASGNYTATITLETGERLIGDGSTGALATHTGITPVTGSAFPTFSGTAPVITCGGNCLTVPAAGNNFLRGFTIGDSGTTGTDITGTTFGTLTVNEVTLNGNGRALNLTTGTLNGNFIDIDVTAGNIGGIALDVVSGTWTVANQVNIGGITNTGINIANSTATTNLTFTGGAVVGVTGAGGGIAVATSNAAAVHNFGTVVITTANGTGLRVDASPITVTGTASTITATSGPAIDATTANFVGGATFATVSSTGSAGKGINLDTVTGALVMNGGAIGTPTGIAFDLNAGAANVTYAGTITSTAANRLIEVTARTGGTATYSGNLSGTGGTHTGINIANNTGGTVNLSGATKTLNTATNAAVTLATNTGSSVNFTGGGLAITTTSGIGFNAIGGATGISVQGTGNTITSTTGTALNAANTTIAAAGLTFQSISSNGAASGVVLNNTGASGGLTISGNGGTCTSAATCTGGAIQNSTGAGVSLTSTLGFSATRLFVGNGGDDGISGGTINGFTLDNSVVSTNGNAVNESGIDVTDAAGTWTISNSTLNANFYDVVRITNSNATLTAFNMSGSTLTNNNAVSGNSGLLMDFSGTGALAGGTISNNTITGIRVINVQILASGGTSSVANLVFDGNITRNAQIAYDLSAVAPASMQYIVRNQTGAGSRISGMNSHGMNGNYGVPGAATAAGTYRGRIQNVDVGDAAVVNSGSAIGNCLRLVHNRDSSSAVIVSGGTLRACPNGRGIEATSRNAGGAFGAASGLDLQVLSANVDPQDTSGFPLSAIFGIATTGGGGANRARLDFRTNTVPAGAALDLQAGFIGAHENGTGGDCQVVDPPPVNANATAALLAPENGNTGSASGSAGCALIAGPLITPP